jgi:succinate dehydrogenase flavin-adding protein (antitoxin of CptAB toxin-antitoxin module)
LLELDLVFEKFWAAEPELSADEIEALERLLTLSDNDLLDLVMGRSETREARLGGIVGRLRGA